VAKKRKKRAEEIIPDKVSFDDGTSKSAEIINPEQQIKLLIEKGQKKGFLTYEEMNDDLPEDAISANRLDRLLATMDEMGISLMSNPGGPQKPRRRNLKRPKMKMSTKNSS